MNEQVKNRLGAYSPEIQEIFLAVRTLVLESSLEPLEELLWANLPTYRKGNRFVRIIPFRDHLNVEAARIRNYADDLTGYTLTPKGMLKIGLKEELPMTWLQRIFQETFETPPEP
ncbi:hypothetical protein KCG48_02320 [Proteiniclasticum sp. BAD-10]|uniref:YdhG-like domain-containing protein n=1 Tax=Proteiniclasticum sediminis TaxID=2804028 RepID=A0A941CM62_9CLOT|nr:hypothetical protein [Proteiniclasticum sediminis]MBR0575167.1 hypothetical protein [Proteiniclasticum sediminis]